MMVFHSYGSYDHAMIMTDFHHMLPHGFIWFDGFMSALMMD
jgi:hypothetical protein